MEFDPVYPTARARQYRDEFVRAADAAGLMAIPEDLISNAINRSIGEQWPANQAGAEFARIYFALQNRRRDIHKANAIKSFQSYLLAWYESSLHSHKPVL